MLAAVEVYYKVCLKLCATYLPCETLTRHTLYYLFCTSSITGIVHYMVWLQRDSRLTNKVLKITMKQKVVQSRSSLANLC